MIRQRNYVNNQILALRSSNYDREYTAKITRPMYRSGSEFGKLDSSMNSSLLAASFFDIMSGTM